MAVPPVSANPFTYVTSSRVSATHHRKTIPVKNNSLQQLPHRERLQHPTPPPRRPGTLHQFPSRPLFPPPQRTAILNSVVSELQRPEPRIDGNRHAELLSGVDTQRQTGEGGTDGGGVGGCQGRRGARVPEPEGEGGGVEEMAAQAGEEAEEYAVKEEYCREGEGEAEGG